MKEERYAGLRKALERLKPCDRELITQRYGYEGPPRTLEELGRVRGLGKEAIRLKIEKIKKKLKRYLLKNVIPPAHPKLPSGNFRQGDHVPLRRSS